MSTRPIFPKEVIDYILKNENTDPYALTLKKPPFPDIDMKTIAQQIQGRKIAQRKFPFLLDHDQFQYPKKESLEQASSERTALYKTKLISGNSFVDLTGGMGIDTYLLGRNFESSVYIEPDKTLYEKTVQNFKQLEFDHCRTYNTTCEDFLKSNTKRFDWAYLDPSRRVSGSRKTSIHNYSPNIIEIQKELFELADNIMIKLSPMQDISECIHALVRVENVWVISVNNDVKELLIHLKPEASSTRVSAVNLLANSEDCFESQFETRHSNEMLSPPLEYLYQPNSAIIKAELQNKYAQQFGLKKLHTNTQLYTNAYSIDNFMGRVFHVKEYIGVNKKEILRVIPELKTNVITKNFPLSPEELVKKFKLKVGGDKYLIAFSDMKSKKVLAFCERVK